MSTSFSEAMGFRVNFFILIVLDLFFYGSALFSVDIIYQHVSTIGPWNREQLMFFVSIMLLIHQFHMALVADNFWVFSATLRLGQLDFDLLKPISSLFSSFLRRIRPGSLINIFLSGGLVIYYGLQVDLSITAWIVLPFGIMFGFILAASLDMLIACGMFWMLEGVGINFLRMELQELSRWPDFIYGAIVGRLLTVVVPILLIGNAPTRFLFDQHDWGPLLGMVVAILIIWGLLQIVWKFGLLAYESASS